MLGRGMNSTSSLITSVKGREQIKGFRFNPTNEELINDFLVMKILGYENQVSAIAEVVICKHEPWDLPGFSKVPSNDYTSNDNTWYFFGRPDYKFRNSKRANRKTKYGYWKVTGKNRIIKKRGTNENIGFKKNLVFYRGRVPNGVKTSWVIHEYHSNFSSANGRDFVICRLKQKSRDKIDNSTIGEGESSHDATSRVENLVTEITFTEMDDFDPPDAHQPEMCMEQGPSVGNLQNINNFTDNYNVPLPQFGTSDLQDNTIKWMNSSTINQDVYSIDGSMPTLPYDSRPSHQSEMCMEQGHLVGTLQNIDIFTDNYNVPLPQFGTSDLQDNTTKWMNSSTATYDVYSIDGSMHTLPYDSRPSHQSEMCMEQCPIVGNLQNIDVFTDNYNVPLPQFGASDRQDNTTKWMNSSTANHDVYSIDGSMNTLPYDSSPSKSFGSLLVDDTEDTEEVNKLMDLQYLEEILRSNKEDFNPSNAHQSEMCMEQGPSVENLQNINSFTDNYTVPLSQCGTSNLQDYTIKWMNSSTANQDVLH